MSKGISSNETKSTLHLREPIGNLSKPFDESEWEWRIQRARILKNGKPKARVLAYITARALQNRLDEVCGPSNWTVSYEGAPNSSKGLLCSIGIRVHYDDVTGESTFIYKQDGAENTDIESMKGGISSAFKRCGVLWGMGRHLYNLADTWADFGKRAGRVGPNYVKIKDQFFPWYPPKTVSYKQNSSPLLDYTNSKPALLNKDISDKDIPF